MKPFRLSSNLFLDVFGCFDLYRLRKKEVLHVTSKFKVLFCSGKALYPGVDFWQQRADQPGRLQMLADDCRYFGDLQ